MPHVAILDACVLYPAPLRDFLVHLALTDAFHARWTDAIHDEWIRNLLLRRKDLKPEQLDRTRLLMNSHIRDCLVVGYEPLIDSVTLPDRDDRHVLAAAIHAQADTIITFNIRDFPNRILHRHGIAAMHPDAFCEKLLETDAALMCLALRRLRVQLKNPPKTAEEVLATLHDNGLARTAASLAFFSDQL